ncbi:MAG: hypothetical protein LUH02_12125 [Erysipelotrichaceae bacterium]|nr:hypothetical protein [Erysipelotrichaceae bacterium]
MIRVLIICSAGITSSMIADELNQSSEGKYIVTNMNISLALKEYWKYQLILVAPQVKFLYEKIEVLALEHNIHHQLLDFDKYNTKSVKDIVDSTVTEIEQKVMHICFIKDKHTGYLPNLFMNKLVSELEKNDVVCMSHIEVFSDDVFNNNFDIYLIEPKLMFYVKENDKVWIIRTQEYQSLIVSPTIERILSFPKDVENKYL